MLSFKSFIPNQLKIIVLEKQLNSVQRNNAYEHFINTKQYKD
jgi:hypothetical protein